MCCSVIGKGFPVVIPQWASHNLSALVFVDIAALWVICLEVADQLIDDPPVGKAFQLHKIIELA